MNATMPAVLENDPDAWALLINGAYRRTYESTIETGRLLIAAKEKLAQHGTWLPMLQEKLDFSPDNAQRLMAIARDERLTNTEHVRFLPRSPSTLYLLSRLSDDQFARGLAEKIIRPDMERKDVEILRPNLARLLPPPISGEERAEPSQPEHHSEGAQCDLASDDHPKVGDTPELANAPLPEAGSVTPSVGDSASPPVKPGGGLSIAHNRVEPGHSLDFFPTPLWATRALIERVFVHLERRNHCQFQVCWEPACGEGHMAEPLKEYFREVVASDVKDYGYGDHTVDFLQCEQLARKYDADWIITNPPFGDKMDQFILKALNMAGTGVAMLVRLQCLETVGRYEKIFRDTPPTLISFFVERVPMHKGRWEPDGDTMTAYIWLTWIKGAKPQAPFWIPPGCRDALTKPDDAARFGVVPEAAE